MKSPGRRRGASDGKVIRFDPLPPYVDAVLARKTPAESEGDPVNI
jgi:hypothetical protein